MTVSAAWMKLKGRKNRIAEKKQWISMFQVALQSSNRCRDIRSVPFLAAQVDLGGNGELEIILLQTRLLLSDLLVDTIILAGSIHCGGI